MKKILATTLLCALIASCGDPCDEGYSQRTLDDGTTICLPDYINGKINDFKFGDTYYHKDFGVITRKDGIWKNEHNETINL